MARRRKAENDDPVTLEVQRTVYIDGVLYTAGIRTVRADHAAKMIKAQTGKEISDGATG